MTPPDHQVLERAPQRHQRCARNVAQEASDERRELG
jgi:hypothetical protein